MKSLKCTQITALVLVTLFSNAYAHKESVHQHVVKEGYKLLKSQLQLQSISGMEEHIGLEFYGYGGSKPWITGLVVVGAWREDVEDPVYKYGDPFSWQVSNTHFWDADAGDGSKINILGAVYENAYQKALRYVDPATYGPWTLLWADEVTGSIRFPLDDGTTKTVYFSPAMGIGYRYNSLMELMTTGRIYVVGYYSLAGNWQDDVFATHIGGQRKDQLVWEICEGVCGNSRSEVCFV